MSNHIKITENLFAQLPITFFANATEEIEVWKAENQIILYARHTEQMYTCSRFAQIVQIIKTIK